MDGSASGLLVCNGVRASCESDVSRSQSEHDLNVSSPLPRDG